MTAWLYLFVGSIFKIVVKHNLYIYTFDNVILVMHVDLKVKRDHYVDTTVFCLQIITSVFFSSYND